MARLPDDCELIPGAELYWDAFWALFADRAPAGLGPPGPIPWLTVDAYARRIGLPDDEFIDLANAVREIDAEYLKILAERMAAGGKG